MTPKVLHIKNMVCDRCISSVRELLQKHQIPVLEVSLGKAVVENTGFDAEALNRDLEKIGFSLLQDKNKILSGQVKALLIEQIHYQTEPVKINISDFLSEALQLDYATISKIFSQTENITIEKFIILQKIEKVKELIDYGECNFSEIAFRLNYSSVSHLSRQFKKNTGLTLSGYKKQAEKQRNSLDKLH